MFTLQKALLISGAAIFVFATLGMFYQEAIMVTLFTLFIPGPLFGLIISIFKKAALLQRVLFFVSACLIYFFTLYLIDIKNIDYKLAPTRILIASVLSAVLVQVLFDIIFRSKMIFLDTVLRPSALGFVSSIVSAIATFFFNGISSTTGWLTIPLWMGLFSIFPLWYFLFGQHLIRSGKISNIYEFNMI